MRKPANLPLDENEMLIKEHLIKTINSFSTFQFLDEKDYVTLRDAACTRLTLFNARRGGEPARLSIAEWLDAKNENWIDQHRKKDLNELDEVLCEKMSVSFITGKGIFLLRYFWQTLLSNLYLMRKNSNMRLRFKL